MPEKTGNNITGSYPVYSPDNKDIDTLYLSPRLDVMNGYVNKKAGGVPRRTEQYKRATNEKTGKKKTKEKLME